MKPKIVHANELEPVPDDVRAFVAQVFDVDIAWGHVEWLWSIQRSWSLRARVLCPKCRCFERFEFEIEQTDLPSLQGFMRRAFGTHECPTPDARMEMARQYARAVLRARDTKESD